MKTDFALLARYEGLPVIPVERVVADFFAPLTVPKFLEKAQAGDIPLPIVRMYGSQRAAKGVNINDLAEYLDKQIETARKEMGQMLRAG